MSNKRALDCEDLMRAVRRLNTLDDAPIVKFLRIGRSTVWRFKRDHPECVKRCQDYLDSVSGENVRADKMTWEIYEQMPIIQDWKDAMNRRRVGQANQRGWMRSFYNLCKYINKVPSRITLEECADVVVAQRDRYYAGEKQIPKIAYSGIRESVRGFFMSVRDVSPMTLTNLGVGKEALLGSGRYSRMKVPMSVRHRYEQLLIDKLIETNDLKYYEALGNSRFNFATGTRISASLEFNFNEHQYNLEEEKWMFEIFDKGSRGKKLRWEKILMGNLLKMFKEYCSKRFDIPIEDLESELPKKTDYLFPSFVSDKGIIQDSKMREIVKPALIEAGIPYKDFPPTHIWRHTFAQEFLIASNYNYELCASLGGWVNTHILKKHYGQMGESARESGLLEAMGLKKSEEPKELRW